MMLMQRSVRPSDVVRTGKTTHYPYRRCTAQPRIILEIADCSERIRLEFEIDSELDVENSLHKVDVLLGTLAEFRGGLVEEACLYRERGPEDERLNPNYARARNRRARR
jgi:hypothetical protein